MSIQISQDYSSMVNFARCKCLGANVLRGPDQIPWDGKLNYDYQLWIDSDIVFDTNKFWQLCDVALPASAIDEEGNEIEGQIVRFLLVGIPQKMGGPPQLHIGWKRMTSVTMVV